jgi:hypothetical protein
MADLVMAKQSFIGAVAGVELDIRAGDLFEVDHPAVTRWPDMFGPPKLRYPVERMAPRVEEATAVPGQRRTR